MPVSAKQAWSGTQVASAASGTRALPLNATKGNPVVFFGVRESATGTLAISDDYGDGVSWSLIKGPIAAAGGGAIITYAWWKVVGDCTGKTVTITNNTNAALSLYSAEYMADFLVFRWALNGSSSNSGTSTTPDPGAITTVRDNDKVIIGCQANDGGAATAVANWTNRASDAVVSANSVEDRFLSLAGSYDPSWTGAPAGSNWAAIGFGLEAMPAIRSRGDLYLNMEEFDEGKFQEVNAKTWW